MRRRAALSTLLLLAASPPPGAASCSGCHAIRAETPVPGIAGRPAAEIVAAMAAFRSGARQGTVMNRIASGFSKAETEVIAAWLSEQPAP